MAFKFFAFLALIAAASAGVLPQVYQAAPLQTHTAAIVKAPVAYTAPVNYGYAHAPVAVAHAQPVLAKHDDEYDPHPQYKFGYDVQDALSGDSKSQVEERDGDVVHGEYSLIDADGFKRTVQYTADPVNGFNAVVNRVPVEHVKTVVKTAPATYVKDVSAPVAYHHLH